VNEGSQDESKIKMDENLTSKKNLFQNVVTLQNNVVSAIKFPKQKWPSPSLWGYFAMDNDKNVHWCHLNFS